MNDHEALEQKQLEALSQKFLNALKEKDAGKIDEAEDSLREVLTTEPRLAEPRMELARILLETDRLTEAESHAREALTQLEETGPWTEEIPQNVLQGLSHALLAEVLRRLADEDDVIFGDPAVFHALVKESQEHFERAAKLDASDDYSSYHAFFLGAPGVRLIGDEADGEASPESEEG